MKINKKINYYTSLGLDLFECDIKIIKKAYRTLAKKYHPDKYSSKKDKESFGKRFLIISAAYETLVSKELKREHDIKLKKSMTSIDSDTQPSWEDLYTFSGGGDDILYGEDVHIFVECTIQELVKGCTKKVQLETGIKNITIPKLSTPEKEIEYIGLGNTSNGRGIPGSLYIIPVLKRSNNIFFNKDTSLLYSTIYLPYQKFALGGNIEIRSILDSTKTMGIVLPENTPPGIEFRLKDQGIKTDLILKFKLRMPVRKLSNKDKELLSALNTSKNLK